MRLALRPAAQRPAPRHARVDTGFAPSRRPRCGWRRAICCLQLAHIDLRPRAFVAADDVVHRASDRSSSVGVDRRHAAVEGLGEDGRGCVRAHRGDRSGRAARRPGGDETVEAVEAQEQAHRRPLAQVQDAHARCVTGPPRRSGTARRADRCPGYASAPCRRGWPAARPARVTHGDLAAQQRNVARTAAVGVGGEQADEAALAVELAVRVEAS